MLDIHGAWKAFASNGLSSLWNEEILVSLIGTSEEFAVLLMGDEVFEESLSSSLSSSEKSEVEVRSKM